MLIEFQSEDKQSVIMKISIEELKSIDYLIRRRSKTIYPEEELVAQSIEPIMQKAIAESIL